MIEYEIHEGIGHTSPYMEALKMHLKKHGIEVKNMPYLPDRRPKQDEKIIHIHRIGRLYSSEDMNSLDVLLSKIDELKTMGWIFVWTIHNIFPINSLMTKVDLRAAHEIGMRMDLVFCHTEIMKQNLKKYFNINAINHGYGADFYLNNGKNSNIRDLWKKEKFSFGFIGNIRGYKGILELLKSYDKLLDEGYDCDLIVAGSPYSSFLEENPQIVELIKKNNVTLYEKYVFKEDWDYIIQNVDVLVFPYKVDLPIFKYGFYASSIAQAVYMKKSIICPKNDNLEEIIGTLDYSFSYNYQEKDALYYCMEKSLRTSSETRKRMEEKAFNMVSHNTWEELAKKIVEYYKKIDIEM